MAFTKYMHVERLTNDNLEIDGILKGDVYIYPKLDGSNHCVWWDNDKGILRCASRNQIITEDYDATKFVHAYLIPNNDKIHEMICDNKNLIFYGEFMKPHVIRDYDNTVWDNWYIFDVFDTTAGKWLPFEEYKIILDTYHMSYIPPMRILENPTLDDLDECVSNNKYLMQDGYIGEGIVIKNYDFINKYGRTRKRF